MSDTDQELPPLGAPTSSADGSSSGRFRRQLAIAAVVALLVGLAAGFALAAALDDDGGDDVPSPPATSVAPTAAPPTQDSLPEECVSTLRAAQETLALLDQGLRDLRNLNLQGVDRAVTEVQRLRDGLDQEVRTCLERMGD